MKNCVRIQQPTKIETENGFVRFFHTRSSASCNKSRLHVVRSKPLDRNLFFYSRRLGEKKRKNSIFNLCEIFFRKGFIEILHVFDSSPVAMAFFLSHLERERVRARVARGVERARWPKIARIYGGTQERNLSTFIEYKWPAPINRAPWSASTAPVHEFILEFFPPRGKAANF